MDTKKILAIDNDRDFLESIKYTLEEENFEVITSLNPREALDILKNDSEILIVLVDLKMDNLSGNEFLKEIEDFKRPLRRIVFTGHQILLSDKEAEDLNIFAYLEKGEGLNSLLFTIRSAFNDLELQEARQWKNLASITTETVHLIGNKISPIWRRINEISKIIIELYSQKKIDENNYNKIIRNIEIIKDGAEQTRSIKSDLIDGSVYKQPINIITILSEVIKKSKNEYDQIEINFSADQDSQIIVADEKIIKRVIGYLIKNAAQAIEDKDTLQPDHEKHFPGIIYIKTCIADDYFIIDIKDNGCGIEKQDLDKIFKPFFTTKGADRGSGVGLYFCKRMMEDLGGNINIKKTQVDAGTTISLKFPIK